MQIQEAKVARLIAKLQLSAFQLKEYKKMDDCQYSNPIYPNQPTGKILQLTYLHKLSTDHLITHLEVQISSPQIFSSMFEFGEIEGNSLPTRSLCGAIRWCGVKQSNQGKFWMVGCACITHALKISLLLKRQFLVIYSDILELKKQKDRQSNEENIMKIIKHTIKEINICGYHLNVSPSASDLIPLLNISQSFKLAYRYHEAAETDVFSSLALIAARRFVQAAEMLRQVSNFYLKSYQPPNNYLDFSKLEKTFNKEECKDNLQVSLISRSFSTGRVLEGGPFLYKAAKIQLLLADTISQPSLLGAKLEAYNRANAFANGVTCPPKINIRIDYHDAILSIGQSILPFLLKILNDKTEILKISALKSIQFFFQNLGCSLGGWVGTTLKKIISIYPKQRQRVSEVGAVGGRWKLIIDHTNRVLQSLVSLIGSLNRKFLLTIFEDIIITSISEEYRNELRLYLLRFAEKIIQICGSDLKLSLPYLSYLFTLVSPGYNNNSLLPHHVNQHLTQLSNRVLLLVKQKVLKNYQHTQLLSSICIWIREALISHCETESSTGLSLHQLLELTIAIYTYNKKTTANPIQAVIYLLNLALSQPKLPFQKLLETLVVLLANNQQFDRQDLCSQITIRGIARLRGGGVKLKQLKVLQKVLEMVDQVKGEWLEDFLQCIPHSNFDEIYLVFDLLFRKSVLHLNKERLQAVIQTLFNQYTVKGKAHQLSKQCMITHLLQNMKNSLLMLIQVCLFGNPEPQIAAYSRIKMFGKQQLVDSKQFRLKSQIFSEKINLLLMVFTKKQLLIEQLTSILTVELICKLHKSFGQILRNSNNAKAKVKVLLLINYIISLLIDINRPPALSPSYILFYKAILQLLKGFVLQSKHTKLHQYCAVNLALVFQLIPRNGTEKQQLQNLMFMDQPVSIHFKVPADLTASSTQALLGNQLLKIWPCLLVLLNSSWQNIRQTAMSSLLYSLRQGLSGMNSSHKNKLTQLVKVLLSQLLYSPDHTERLTGLKLLCLTLGMGRNYTNDQELARQIRQNSYRMKEQVQRTLQLSDDWNPEIVHYSRLVTQICLSEWQRENLLSRKLHKPGQNSLCLQQYYLDSQEKRQNNSDIIGNLQEMLKLDQSGQEQNQESYPPLTAQQLAHISQFKQAIENIKFEDCSSMAEKESFVQEQHYLDANDEQQHSDKETSNRSQEQPLEFQDLGIIELDDEQWAQEENQLKITQKLPLKKIYKLSPNLASSSKHHRLSNNRLYPSEIQQRIVVDQVEANIPTPVVQQKQIYRGAEKQSGKQWTQQLGLSWEEVNDKQWPQSRVNKNKGREKKGSKKGRSSK